MATEPIKTSLPNRMGRWACLERVFTVVYPAGWEPPAHLVKRIRVFFPTFVPVLRLETFRTPANTEKVEGRWCIGRWAETADEPEDLPIQTERPDDFPFHGGVIYVVRAWVEPPPPKLALLGWPDAFLPFDDRMANFLEEIDQFTRRTPGTLKAKVLANLAADQDYKERELEKLEEEYRYRLREDGRQVMKAIEEERFTPTPRPAPQPYVHADKVMEGTESPSAPSKESVL